MPAPNVYTAARRITPGTGVSSGSGIVIACSAEGTVRLVMHDGSFLDVYVFPGTTKIDALAVKDVNVAGTTATATVSVVA